MSQLYFEDFSVGDEFASGGVTLTESDIIEFALKYDPQSIHLDVEAASRSIYGGLIASGWHVIGLAFRMFIQAGILGEASMGSPGLEEVRWLKPVRPGDTVHMKARVGATRPSKTKDDRGYLTMEFRIVNQHDEVVTTLRSIQIMARRPAASEREAGSRS